jgi:hypothetical protein
MFVLASHLGLPQGRTTFVAGMYGYSQLHKVMRSVWMRGVVHDSTSILDHVQLFLRTFAHRASTSDAYTMNASMQRPRIRYHFMALSWKYELTVVQALAVPPSIPLSGEH